MKLKVKFKTPGFADCDIEVQAKGFLAASVYWADKNGPLSEWSSLAVFPINPSGTGSYSFDGHRAIPIAATHLCAKCISSDFSKVEEGLFEIPEAFRPQILTGSLIGAFSLMSDLHLSGKPGKILRALNAVNSDILIAGDLVNDGYANQFQLFQKCIEETAADKRILSVTGNHDQLLKAKDTAESFGYDAFQEYLFTRAGNMGYQFQKDISNAYAVCQNNIDIIGLQCVSVNRKFGFSAETLTWLQAHLEHTKDLKWHIILCHAPLLAHNPHRNDGAAYYHGNDILQGILDNYTHIIFVSGHTHFSPNTRQGNVEYLPDRHTIYIDAGSIVPTELTGEPLMPAEWHDGVIAELVFWDSIVEIKYHSIHTGKLFPRGYYCFHV